VHVESIVADGRVYEASSGVRLPPLVRDLAIEYTATSLVAPEKMQFKYKLDGRDTDWNDAGNRRQAFYTDLDPVATNSASSPPTAALNEQGATLDPPSLRVQQTNWFRALCVAFLALLWTPHRLRVHQLAQSSTSPSKPASTSAPASRDLRHAAAGFRLAVALQTARHVREPTHRRTQGLDGAIDQAADAITRP
jgi:hypothetical protein